MIALPKYGWTSARNLIGALFNTANFARSSFWCVLMVGVSLLSACTSGQTRLQSESTSPIESTFPHAYYQNAIATGQRVLKIDSARSLLVLEVRRAGVFARLGHDHVVASHDVSGFVAPDLGRADLLVPLDKLAVDESALRSEAGFTTQPTAEDVAGTRHNMLSKVLETQKYPAALIHIAQNISSTPAATTATAVLTVSITLHGVTRTYSVAPTIVPTADGLIVSGSMQFTQSEFGITPFSILNGAIRVQDELNLRFRIVAIKR